MRPSKVLATFFTTFLPAAFAFFATFFFAFAFFFAAIHTRLLKIEQPITSLLMVEAIRYAKASGSFLNGVVRARELPEALTR